MTEIVSASRRTDIPAFYSRWLMNRIDAGYCMVPHPMSPSRVARVGLTPDEVGVIVFWTRHPRPLLPHLKTLDERGYRYYFQYTLLGYPRLLDQRGPSVDAALTTFRELADTVGPERVIWRYDPILLSRLTGADFHRRTYAMLAERLRGHTRRSVVSVLDSYPKVRRRLAGLGVEPAAWGEPFAELIRALAAIARGNGMRIESCAEEIDLTDCGVRPGKCIDDDLVRGILGVEATDRKDPGQRAACGCVVSRDIGMYESCPFGCQYCYATTSFERARGNHRQHDPLSPSLLG